MANIFGGSQEQQIYVYLSFFSCLLAAICSFTVIFLIRKMNLRNGHVLLIEAMSWYQLVYDITEFPSTVAVGNSAVGNVADAVNGASGMASSLTSNFIALIAYYVVRYIESVDVYKHFPLIMACVLAPGVVFIIVYAMSCHAPNEYLNYIALNGMYFYIRLISILINFLLSTLTTVTLFRRRSKNISSFSPVFNSKDKMSVSEQAIRTLAFRLVYYPIVQAISRGAITWYEAVYGFNFDPTTASPSQYIGMCLFAFFVPSASYGYLIIFLLMQPDAWECLKCTLTCRLYISKRSCTNSIDVLTTSTNSSLHRETSLANTAVIEIDNRPTFDQTPSIVVTSQQISEADEDELWNLAQGKPPTSSTGRYGSSIGRSFGGKSMGGRGDGSMTGNDSTCDVEIGAMKEAL